MRAVDIARGICAIYRENIGGVIDEIRLQQYMYISQIEHMSVVGVALFESDMEYWGDAYLSPVQPAVYAWYKQERYNENRAVRLTFDAYYILYKVVKGLQDCSILQLFNRISGYTSYQRARGKARSEYIQRLLGYTTEQDYTGMKAVVDMDDIISDVKQRRREDEMRYYMEQEKYMFAKEQIRKDVGEVDVVEVGEGSSIINGLLQKRKLEPRPIRT